MVVAMLIMIMGGGGIKIVGLAVYIDKKAPVKETIRAVLQRGIRTAANFVTAILAIQLHVAMEGSRDALVLRRALEFVVTAG